MSFTFNIFIVLWISSVCVLLSLCNINFNNLFCVTCIVLIFLAEQFPYTSIPYLILEYMNGWYSYLANLFVTLYLILLKIPKYLISDLPKHSTCSLNRKVSSRVQLKYWNDLTLLKVISLVTISSICFGIGLFVAWNSISITRWMSTHLLLGYSSSHNTWTRPYRLQIAWYNLGLSAWSGLQNVS